MWFASHFNFNFFLFQRLLNWLNPINRCETELARLLRPRQKCHRLFILMENGRSAEKLVAYFKEIADNNEVPKIERGNACLLLSILFREELQTSKFYSPKNEVEAENYRKKALEYLGSRPVVSKQIKTALNCIRLGGEPQFAFAKLNQYANGASASYYTAWSNKILSFVYRKGMSNDNLLILPDIIRAHQCRQIAKKGLRKFPNKLQRLTKELASSSFFHEKASSLIKKIADLGDKNAMYQYAVYLEKKKASLGEIKSYYKRAAKKTKETVLSFKERGNSAALKKLIKIASIKDPDPEAVYRSSHYRLQVALDRKDPANRQYAKQLLEEANKGSWTAKLHAGIYYLNKQPPSIEEAEKQFHSIVNSLPRQMSSATELDELDQFCFKLGCYYEQLFLKEPSSLTFNLDETAKFYLAKIIAYYKYLPPSFKRYTELQVKIAHYQKYCQGDLPQAITTFADLSKEDDLHAHSSILCGFEDYWLRQSQQYSVEEKVAIANYEQSNIPFFHSINANQLKATQTSDAIALLEKLLQEIKASCQSFKHFVPVLANTLRYLSVLIDMAKTNNVPIDSLAARKKRLFTIMGQTDPALKKECQFLSAAQDKLKDPFANFFTKSVTENDLAPYKPMLRSLLYFFDLFKNQREQTPSLYYFELLERTYLGYLATVIHEILPFQVATTIDEATLSSNVINEGAPLCKIKN